MNSSKTVTDQPVNSQEAAPRPERNGSTRTRRAKTSSARASRAHTGRAQAGRAQAGPGPDGTGPAGPAGQQPARRHQRDLPIAGTRPSRSSTAGAVVLAYLRVQAHELRSLDQAVRADEYDAVHQMRVATRRLRATLRSFGRVIPRAETTHLARELKWLGQLLGAARDDEVLPVHLRDALRPVPDEDVIGPVHARVQGHFAPRRAAGHAAVIEALDSPRYAELLAELDLLTTGPLDGRQLGPQAGDPARDVLPKAVRKAYRQADRRMRSARRTPSGPARDVALHQARKSARRARYAAEAAALTSGKPARRFARQMKKVQSVLGEHQDAVLARRSARDLGIGAHLAGENAFTYGLLHERERHQAARLQAAARKTWQKASRKRRLTWLS
ncbi:MAG TPA: CHAD domain-containing protein [Streptosporangiaceae bacterium]|nr:CHAD domain-containing protein [Streptosporangiaceae bacterium]